MVFLPGLIEGTLPIIYAETDEAVAEERRLLYVGVTRAREQLLPVLGAGPVPGGRRAARRPRRPLPGRDAPRPLGRRRRRPGGGRPSRARHLRVARPRAARGTKLREWRRRGRAGAAGVAQPAYVVEVRAGPTTSSRVPQSIAEHGRPPRQGLPASPVSGPASWTGTVPRYWRCARRRRARRPDDTRRMPRMRTDASRL